MKEQLIKLVAKWENEIEDLIDEIHDDKTNKDRIFYANCRLAFLTDFKEELKQILAEGSE
jgi:hypothetical protein